MRVLEERGGKETDRRKERGTEERSFHTEKKMDESKQVEGRCRNNDENRRQGVGPG